MIDELQVSDTAPLVEAYPNGNQEIVFLDTCKRTGNLFINKNVFLLSYIALAVHESLANAGDLITVFVLKAESFIEGKVFFPLVHDLLESVFTTILINFHLDLKSIVMLVVAYLELGQVTELSNQRILVEPAEKSESDWLQLLVGLRRQCLIIWVLHIPYWNLLKEVDLLGLLDVVHIDLGQSLLELEELVLVLLHLLLLCLFHHLHLQGSLRLVPHHSLLQILQLFLQLLVLIV